MPRRRVVEKREVLADPKYHSKTVSRFINVVMLDGKKAIAEKIVYGSLDKAIQTLGKKVELQDRSGDGDGGTTGTDAKTKRLAVHIFEQALENVSPTVEVRSRRVGGATYQIPVEVRALRSVALAMRWIVQAARARSEKGMVNRLASELVDAYEKRGTAVKKREETHRMAKANQAFAHFRWN